MAQILGFNFYLGDLNTLVAEMATGATGFKRCATINLEILGHSRSQPDLNEWLDSCTWKVADGMGLKWVARWRSGVTLNRIAGIDLAEALIRHHPWRIALIGGSPVVIGGAERAVMAFNPESQLVMTRHGFFQDDEIDDVISTVVRSRPTLVLVAMGTPKQDRVLAKLADQLNQGIGIGVGGAFDVWAGQVNRAPKWIQRIGLEWAFRIAQRPSRLRRLPPMVKAALFS